MSARQICYRDIQRYKYRLLEDYHLDTREHDISFSIADDITTPFIDFAKDGRLTIRKDYAWDGPSGPTVDTSSFMRGALVHDAFYQLLREGQVAPDQRKSADDLMKKLCRQDGMSRFRAWYTHRAVRRFAEFAARPSTRKAPDPIP